jgi:hypothetical protein
MLARRSGSQQANPPDVGRSALVKALARAFRYQKLLGEGRYASTSELAEETGPAIEFWGMLRARTLAARRRAPPVPLRKAVGQPEHTAAPARPLGCSDH